eukprot:6192982-Pleurochrysis_carterae.AAC.1
MDGKANAHIRHLCVDRRTHKETCTHAAQLVAQNTRQKGSMVGPIRHGGKDTSSSSHDKVRAQARACAGTHRRTTRGARHTARACTALNPTARTRQLHARPHLGTCQRLSTER